MFREDFTRTQIINQQTLSEQTVAIRAHEDKAEGRVKAINDHTSHVGEDITNLFGEAVTVINSATTEAVAPALAALVEIKEFFTALNGLQKEQMETLKLQQHEQMNLLQKQQTAQLDYLTEQQDGWTRIVQNLVVRAEKTIIESIHTETIPDEKPVEIPPVTDRPDAGTPEPALVSDGGIGPGTAP